MLDYFKVVRGFLNKEELRTIYLDIVDPKTLFDNHQNLLILGYNEFKSDKVRNMLSSHSKKVHDLIESDTGIKLEPFNKNKTHIEKFISGSCFENKYEPGKEISLGILCFINNFKQIETLRFGDINIKNLSAGDLIIYPEIEKYTRNMDKVDEDFYAMIQWFTPESVIK